MTEYVAIKLKGNNSLEFRQLPLLLGSSANSDIIVNTPAMSSVAKIIFVEADALKVKDVNNGHMQPPESLQKSGLRIIGPISGDIKKAKSVLGILRLISVIEKQAFASLPSKLQRWLAGDLNQWQRLVTWAGVLLITGAFYSMIFDDEQILPDFSNRPIPTEVGRIIQATYGQKGRVTPYAGGVSFGFDLDPLSTKKPLMLMYQYIEIDMQGELQLLINDEPLKVLNADLNCLDRFCQDYVKISVDQQTDGKNVLAFIHDKKGKDYGIRNVLIRPLEKITPEEKIVLDRTVKLAERFYEDRNIVVENLINARKEAVKALQILDRSVGVEQLRPNLVVLKDNIDKAYDEKVSTLFFKLKKNMKLGDFAAAEDQLKKLLVLHPNSQSNKHQFLKKRLADVRRLMQ